MILPCIFPGKIGFGKRILDFGEIFEDVFGDHACFRLLNRMGSLAAMPACQRGRQHAASKASQAGQAKRPHVAARGRKPTPSQAKPRQAGHVASKPRQASQA